MTHTQIIDWFRTAEGHAWNPRTDRPNIRAIIAAINAGTITPDDNDGLITDPTEQLLFGAITSGDETLWANRIDNLTDLALMAGSATTDDEAARLRDLLVDINLLDWISDSDGGWLVATDSEFDAAVAQTVNA